MASRSKYTYTPTYNNRQPVKPSPSAAKQRKASPAQRAPVRNASGRSTQQRQPAAQRAPVRQTKPVNRNAQQTPQLAGDTLVLLMLFLIVPITGLFALFFQPMRWVFCVVSILAMVSMWALRCFLPRGRAFLSGVLSVLAIISLVAAFPSAQEENVFPQFGEQGASGSSVFTNYTTDPALVGLVSPSSVPEGEQEPSGDDLVGAASADESLPRTKSAAESILESYLSLWQSGNDWNDMVQYTSPEWRESVQSPVQQLFYYHKTKILTSWTITPPAIADNDTAATIDLVCVIQLPQGTQEKVKYNALMQLVDGAWFLDPASLNAGVSIVDPTPTPDPNNQPTPTPAPTVKPSTALYYNKAGGGTMYHTQKDCSSINKKYWSNMVSFKYSQLGEKAYSKLTPCKTCSAPARPD